MVIPKEILNGKMGVEMRQHLVELLESLRNGINLNQESEEATKQGIILRILKELGWDPFNTSEVYPEYSVEPQKSGFTKKVDYALMHDGNVKVFIEAKKIVEDLSKHQEQLLNYSFKKGVPLAILTNGISWWFYLPLREGSWEQRKFYTIEILDQDPHEVAKRFEELLSRENVVSDKAIENANKLFESRKKEKLIRETLPKAWQKLLTDLEEGLGDLIATTTEKLCGYTPDMSMIEEFLSRVTTQNSFPSPKRESTSRKEEVSSQPTSNNFTGKTISGFTFLGEHYEVNSWKELLLKVLEILYLKNQGNFEEILKLSGRKRPYFSKNPNELRIPSRINGSSIFVETNLSANSIVKLIMNVLKTLGYQENDLLLEVQ